MGTKDNKTLGFFILINIFMAIGLVVLGVLYQNLNHKLEQIQHGAPENHKVRFTKAYSQLDLSFVKIAVLRQTSWWRGSGWWYLVRCNHCA